MGKDASPIETLKIDIFHILQRNTELEYFSGSISITNAQQISPMPWLFNRNKLTINDLDRPSRISKWPKGFVANK